MYENLLGEFLGTAVLLIFGCGVVANVLLKGSKGENSGWIVITTGWAFAVLLGIFTAVAAGAPQADLNPAVTLAKTMMGVYSANQAVMTMIAELCGGIAGAIICWLVYLPHWEATEDAGLKLAVFATGPAIRNTGANLLCEIIATAMLILMIFAIFHANNGKFPAGDGPY